MVCDLGKSGLASQNAEELQKASASTPEEVLPTHRRGGAPDSSVRSTLDGSLAPEPIVSCVEWDLPALPGVHITLPMTLSTSCEQGALPNGSLHEDVFTKATPACVGPRAEKQPVTADAASSPLANTAFASVDAAVADVVVPPAVCSRTPPRLSCFSEVAVPDTVEPLATGGVAGSAPQAANDVCGVCSSIAPAGDPQHTPGPSSGVSGSSDEASLPVPAVESECACLSSRIEDATRSWMTTTQSPASIPAVMGDAGSAVADGGDALQAQQEQGPGDADTADEGGDLTGGSPASSLPRSLDAAVTGDHPANGDDDELRTRTTDARAQGPSGSIVAPAPAAQLDDRGTVAIFSGTNDGSDLTAGVVVPDTTCQNHDVAQSNRKDLFHDDPAGVGDARVHGGRGEDALHGARRLAFSDALLTPGDLSDGAGSDSPPCPDVTTSFPSFEKLPSLMSRSSQTDGASILDDGIAARLEDGAESDDKGDCQTKQGDNQLAALGTSGTAEQTALSSPYSSPEGAASLLSAPESGATSPHGSTSSPGYCSLSPVLVSSRDAGGDASPFLASGSTGSASSWALASVRLPPPLASLASFSRLPGCAAASNPALAVAVPASFLSLPCSKGGDSLRRGIVAPASPSSSASSAASAGAAPWTSSFLRRQDRGGPELCTQLQQQQGETLAALSRRPASTHDSSEARHAPCPSLCTSSGSHAEDDPNPASMRTTSSSILATPHFLKLSGASSASLLSLRGASSLFSPSLPAPSSPRPAAPSTSPASGASAALPCAAPGASLHADNAAQLQQDVTVVFSTWTHTLANWAAPWGAGPEEGGCVKAGERAVVLGELFWVCSNGEDAESDEGEEGGSPVEGPEVEHDAENRSQRTPGLPCLDQKAPRSSRATLASSGALASSAPAGNKHSAWTKSVIGSSRPLLGAGSSGLRRSSAGALGASSRSRGLGRWRRTSAARHTSPTVQASLGDSSCGAASTADTRAAPASTGRGMMSAALSGLLLGGGGGGRRGVPSLTSSLLFSGSASDSGARSGPVSAAPSPVGEAPAGPADGTPAEGGKEAPGGQPGKCERRTGKQLRLRKKLPITLPGGEPWPAWRVGCVSSDAGEVQQQLTQTVGAIARFTYRTGFAPMYKCCGEKKKRAGGGAEREWIAINSDVGWGCTVRAAQMLLLQALRRHFLEAGEDEDGDETVTDGSSPNTRVEGQPYLVESSAPAENGPERCRGQEGTPVRGTAGRRLQETSEPTKRERSGRLPGTAEGQPTVVEALALARSPQREFESDASASFVRKVDRQESTGGDLTSVGDVSSSHASLSSGEETEKDKLSLFSSSVGLSGRHPARATETRPRLECAPAAPASSTRRNRETQRQTLESHPRATRDAVPGPERSHPTCCQCRHDGPQKPSAPSSRVSESPESSLNRVAAKASVWCGASALAQAACGAVRKGAGGGDQGRDEMEAHRESLQPNGGSPPLPLSPSRPAAAVRGGSGGSEREEGHQRPSQMEELLQWFLDVPSPPGLYPFSIFSFIRAAGGGIGWARQLYGELSVERELFGVGLRSQGKPREPPTAPRSPPATSGQNEISPAAASFLAGKGPARSSESGLPSLTGASKTYAALPKAGGVDQRSHANKAHDGLHEGGGRTSGARGETEEPERKSFSLFSISNPHGSASSFSSRRLFFGADGPQPERERFWNRGTSATVGASSGSPPTDDGDDENPLERRGLGKFAGEWFGPATASSAVKLLVESMPQTKDELYVYVNADGLLYLDDILLHCRDAPPAPSDGIGPAVCRSRAPAPSAGQQRRSAPADLRRGSGEPCAPESARRTNRWEQRQSPNPPACSSRVPCCAPCDAAATELPEGSGGPAVSCGEGEETREGPWAPPATQGRTHGAGEVSGASGQATGNAAEASKKRRERTSEDRARGAEVRGSEDRRHTCRETNGLCGEQAKPRPRSCTSAWPSACAPASEPRPAFGGKTEACRGATRLPGGQLSEGPSACRSSATGALEATGTGLTGYCNNSSSCAEEEDWEEIPFCGCGTPRLTLVSPRASAAGGAVLSVRSSVTLLPARAGGVSRRPGAPGSNALSGLSRPPLGTPAAAPEAPAAAGRPPASQGELRTRKRERDPRELEGALEDPTASLREDNFSQSSGVPGESGGDAAECLDPEACGCAKHGGSAGGGEETLTEESFEAAEEILRRLLLRDGDGSERAKDAELRPEAGRLRLAGQSGAGALVASSSCSAVISSTSSDASAAFAPVATPASVGSVDWPLSRFSGSVVSPRVILDEGGVPALSSAVDPCAYTILSSPKGPRPLLSSCAPPFLHASRVSRSAPSSPRQSPGPARNRRETEETEACEMRATCPVRVDLSPIRCPQVTESDASPRGPETRTRCGRKCPDDPQGRSPQSAERGGEAEASSDPPLAPAAACDEEGDRGDWRACAEAAVDDSEPARFYASGSGFLEARGTGAGFERGRDAQSEAALDARKASDADCRVHRALSDPVSDRIRDRGQGVIGSRRGDGAWAYPSAECGSPDAIHPKPDCRATLRRCRECFLDELATLRLPEPATPLAPVSASASVPSRSRPPPSAAHSSDAQRTGLRETARAGKERDALRKGRCLDMPVPPCVSSSTGHARLSRPHATRPSSASLPGTGLPLSADAETRAESAREPTRLLSSACLIARLRTPIGDATAAGSRFSSGSPRRNAAASSSCGLGRGDSPARGPPSGRPMASFEGRCACELDEAVVFTPRATAGEPCESAESCEDVNRFLLTGFSSATLSPPRAPAALERPAMPPRVPRLWALPKVVASFAPYREEKGIFASSPCVSSRRGDAACLAAGGTSVRRGARDSSRSFHSSSFSVCEEGGERTGDNGARGPLSSAHNSPPSPSAFSQFLNTSRSEGSAAPSDGSATGRWCSVETLLPGAGEDDILLASSVIVSHRNPLPPSPSSRVAAACLCGPRRAGQPGRWTDGPQCGDAGLGAGELRSRGPRASRSPRREPKPGAGGGAAGEDGGAAGGDRCFFSVIEEAAAHGPESREDTGALGQGEATHARASDDETDNAWVAFLPSSAHGHAATPCEITQTFPDPSPSPRHRLARAQMRDIRGERETRRETWLPCSGCEDAANESDHNATGESALGGHGGDWRGEECGGDGDLLDASDSAEYPGPCEPRTDREHVAAHPGCPSTGRPRGLPFELESSHEWRSKHPGAAGGGAPDAEGREEGGDAAGDAGLHFGGGAGLLEGRETVGAHQRSEEGREAREIEVDEDAQMLREGAPHEEDERPRHVGCRGGGDADGYDEGESEEDASFASVLSWEAEGEPACEETDAEISWHRGCVLLFPLTLCSGEKLNPVYVPSLLAYLELPWSIGMVAGRGQQAFYCIGTQQKALLYLDPHSGIQPPALQLPSATPSFFAGSCWKLSDVTALNPSLAVAFFVRSSKQLFDLAAALKNIELADHFSMLQVVERRPSRPESLGLLEADENFLCTEEDDKEGSLASGVETPPPPPAAEGRQDTWSPREPAGGDETKFPRGSASSLFSASAASSFSSFSFSFASSSFASTASLAPSQRAHSAWGEQLTEEEAKGGGRPEGLPREADCGTANALHIERDAHSLDNATPAPAKRRYDSEERSARGNAVAASATASQAQGDAPKLPHVVAEGTHEHDVAYGPDGDAREDLFLQMHEEEPRQNPPEGRDCGDECFDGEAGKRGSAPQDADETSPLLARRLAEPSADAAPADRCVEGVERIAKSGASAPASASCGKGTHSAAQLSMQRTSQPDHRHTLGDGAHCESVELSACEEAAQQAKPLRTGGCEQCEAARAAPRGSEPRCESGAHGGMMNGRPRGPQRTARRRKARDCGGARTEKGLAASLWGMGRRAQRCVRRLDEKKTETETARRSTPATPADSRVN
ncbi:hypothetical protein BESB_056440 [Besnoitia besnoiti]|uniref:Peptidase C54 catalytic domain-containing protein n=1 Tax=Besnoitia besnoiti TaxID=94643 RepID=A0A2A9MK04_BESBE|nr:hypothetical protein BESB_056440 [Besnoitia besnoiti]PFH35993.1 hypothetical protein BESB_056440 [Besnoitia besnoiti]